MRKEKDLIKYLQENVGMIDLVISKNGSIFYSEDVKNAFEKQTKPKVQKT